MTEVSNCLRIAIAIGLGALYFGGKLKGLVGIGESLSPDERRRRATSVVDLTVAMVLVIAALLPSGWLPENAINDLLVPMILGGLALINKAIDEFSHSNEVNPPSTSSSPERKPYKLPIKRKDRR